MRSYLRKTALMMSLCCVFAAFGTSCSDKKSGKESSPDSEPETPEISSSVSPEDFSSAVFSGLNRDGLYGEFDTLYAAAGAEDPFASALGYMIDDDVLEIVALGNDDPIGSFDHMLSSATGNTPDYKDNFVPKPYFTAVEPEISFNEDIVSQEEYGTMICYKCGSGSGDAYVDADLTIPGDGRLCFHIGSDEYYRQTNVWLSRSKEAGEFTDFQSLGTYGTDGIGHVLDAGTFNKGEEIRVRFTIPADGGTEYSGEEFFMVNGDSGFNFYCSDEAALEDDLEQFTAQPFVLDEEKSSYDELVGTVTAEEGKILMTSIPLETEHTITVDGRKFGSLVDDNLGNKDGDEGEVAVFGEFIGLKLPEGEHEVKISFTEKCGSDELRAMEDFTELVFEDGDSERMAKKMFPEDLTDKTDSGELTDYFYLASESRFRDAYPDCEIVSKSFRRLRTADDKDCENIKWFYNYAYTYFNVEHNDVSLGDAGIYLLIAEYENSSGETKKAYFSVSAAEIDGEWCVYFL